MTTPKQPGQIVAFLTSFGQDMPTFGQAAALIERLTRERDEAIRDRDNALVISRKMHSQWVAAEARAVALASAKGAPGQ